MPVPPKPPIDLSDLKNLPKLTKKLSRSVEDVTAYWDAHYPGELASRSPGGNIELARINVYCTNYHWLYIVFLNQPLPPNFYSEFTLNSHTVNLVCAYANISEFMQYLDMLRNEKPIRVTFGLDVTPPDIAIYPRDNHIM